MTTWKWQALTLLTSLTITSSWVGCSSQSTQTAASSSAVTLASSTIPPPVDTNANAAPLQRLDPIPSATSPEVAEVAKLAQAGVEEGVLLSYIESCPKAFNPTVDDILYLNDLGVSAKVISTMIQHRQEAPSSTTSPPSVDTASVTQAAPTINVPPATDNALATQPVAEAVSSPPNYVGMEPPPTTSAPTVYVPEVPQGNVFYEPLAPYGSWLELPGYGWCWQPTTVAINPGWRPYADRGRWIYSEDGWYWQSDYSWGWAPFHYGRWLQHHRCGWVWMPDSVWSPAWVSWRVSPTYCGWAPLPPGACYEPGFGLTYHHSTVPWDYEFGLSMHHFTFLPWRHFVDHNPHPYFAPVAEARGIYANTKVSNRYITGRNNAIINEGFGNERLEAFRPGKLRAVPVRELTPQIGKAIKPDRLEKEGDNVVIYRPQLNLANPPKPAVLTSRNQQEIPPTASSGRSPVGINKELPGEGRPANARRQTVDPLPVTEIPSRPGSGSNPAASAIPNSTPRAQTTIPRPNPTARIPTINPTSAPALAPRSPERPNTPALSMVAQPQNNVAPQSSTYAPPPRLQVNRPSVQPPASRSIAVAPSRPAVSPSAAPNTANPTWTRPSPTPANQPSYNPPAANPQSGYRAAPSVAPFAPSYQAPAARSQPAFNPPVSTPQPVYRAAPTIAPPAPSYQPPALRSQPVAPPPSSPIRSGSATDQKNAVSK